MKKSYDVLRFILKCILIPLAAVMIIWLLNKPYYWIDNDKYWDISKFSILTASYDHVDVGNLGSSHGAYDFDYTALEERGYSCFNFANTSQSYNYDLAILKEFGDYMTKDSVMFIPVSYFSFNNEVINESEAQAMSLRYYRFLSPENIPDYDPYVDLITNRLPILSAGEDILKLFPYLKNKYKLSQIVLAADNTAVSGNDDDDEQADTAENDAESAQNDTTEDDTEGAQTDTVKNDTEGAQADTVENDTEEFAARAKARYSRHFDNKTEYFMPERIDELYDIINYCKGKDITPVLITTPFSSYYKELVSEEFLKEFNDTVNKVKTDTGVSYYDYSEDERFYKDLTYFADCDHLNEKGSEYFMNILLDEVAELDKFK